MKKPNIFIMMTEDICPNFGCYGDTNALTPRIDEFAKDNIRFTYCSSAAPVCSAARTSLNLGMFGSAAGVGQHRSCSPLPPYIKNIGEYMQEAGYFTAIGKTDFNFPHIDNKGYDMAVATTTKDDLNFSQSYLDVINAAGDKPVFMVQTTACTHQSQYGHTEDKNEHRETMPRLKEDEYQVREEIDIPGYHFDSVEAREIWGQYHEKITTLDRMFGEAIENLKKAGKYEDSIIFFVGDNGHGIPLGKCELWDEGVHVPFILHVPQDMESQFDLKEDQCGRYTDRMASFIDFAITSLSLADAEIPPHLQGRILLGKNREEDPTEIYSYSERVDEVFENSRCVREKDKLFTCDFGYSLYRRPNMYQTTSSPWFLRSMIEEGYAHEISDTDRRAFFRAMPRITEQMFDLTVDRNQLENIAVKEENAEEVARMREVLLKNVKKYRDGVFMPEPFYYEYMKKTGKPVYEVFQDDTCYPLDRLIDLWRDCVTGKEITDVNKETAPERMMLAKFCADRNELDKIKVLLNDESEVVRAYTAFRLGDNETIENILQTTDNFLLSLYIADLIAFWWDGKGTKSLEILIDRQLRKLQNGEFEFVMNDRYIRPMNSSLNMLAARYGYRIPDDIKSQKWPDHEQAHSELVLAALKR
ncbi:MAG: sulfatase-like hydrolase/transferase [Clostridia bacterium]